MTDRATAIRVLRALSHTPIGGEAVLVGSSGLFGFPSRVPALTEDVDVSVPEDVVARFGPQIVERLGRQGFEHEPGTATFVSSDGVTFDLRGHGNPEAGDHIGGTGELRVMVFDDLSRIVGGLGAVMALPEGGRALTPPGFVACKLLTERAHKGTKDTLQALLVIAEQSDSPEFEAELVHLFRAIDPIRLDDVQGGAQDAFLALSKDPTFSDAGAEGYVDWLRDAERGLAWLTRLLEVLHE